MLCRNFEVVPIGFLQIFKVAQKSGQSEIWLMTNIVVHGHRPNFTKNEKVRILHFYIFS